MIKSRQFCRGIFYGIARQLSIKKWFLPQVFLLALVPYLAAAENFRWDIGFENGTFDNFTQIHNYTGYTADPCDGPTTNDTYYEWVIWRTTNSSWLGDFNTDDEFASQVCRDNFCYGTEHNEKTSEKCDSYTLLQFNISLTETTDIYLEFNYGMVTGNSNFVSHIGIMNVSDGSYIEIDNVNNTFKSANNTWINFTNVEPTRNNISIVFFGENNVNNFVRGSFGIDNVSIYMTDSVADSPLNISDFVYWYNLSKYVNGDDYDDLGTNNKDIDNGTNTVLVNDSEHCVGNPCLNLSGQGSTVSGAVEYIYGNPVSGNWTAAVQVNIQSAPSTDFNFLFGGNNPNIGEKSSEDFACSMQQDNGTQFPSVTILNNYAFNTHYTLICWKNDTKLCGQVNDGNPTCTDLNGAQTTDQWFTFGRSGKNLNGTFISGAIGYTRYLDDSERTELYNCLSTRGDPRGSCQVTNQSPTINSVYPSGDFTTNITNVSTFNITYSANDNDALNITWWLNGSKVQTGGSNYSTSFGSVGIYNITVNVTDFNTKAYHTWMVTTGNFTVVNQQNANESEADTAILAGIQSSEIWTATVHDAYQVGAANTSNQFKGTFDKFAIKENKRWALNYVSSGESSISGLFNITPTLYVLQIQNKTSAQITDEVGRLINSTYP